MLRKLAFYCLPIVVLSLVSCNNDRKAAENAASKAVERVVNQDSIRQLYGKLIQNRRDSMRTKQIVEVGKLYPVDEAPTDTSFYVFREGLKDIIQQRDKFRLLEVVDANIQIDFGGPAGVAPFVEAWNLDSPKDSSAIWSTLENILALGGTFDGDKQTFMAPYYTATFPDTYDASSMGVVLGQGVRVRAGTDLNSQILKTISYDILPVLDWEVKPDTIDGVMDQWVKVKLSEKQEGFIFGKFVGSPYDYRAVFTRQPNSTWHLTALVHGD
ncbi:MAG: hypothetical protein ACK4TA_00050 [Saprospiraceae bacterium]